MTDKPSSPSGQAEPSITCLPEFTERMMAKTGQAEPSRMEPALGVNTRGPRCGQTAESGRDSHAEALITERRRANAAEAQLTVAEQDRDEARTAAAQWRDQLAANIVHRNDALKHRDAAEQREARLREALERYGKHPASCPKGTGIGYYVPPADAVCDCGIDAALFPSPKDTP